MKQYILSVDQGTTSSRAILFDHSGRIVHTAQQEFEQIFPKPGWVEHNPMEIWQSQLSVINQVLSKVKGGAESINSIGITNQRETTIVWDRATGEPIYNAIVWQDRRTAKRANELKSQGLADKIQNKTGLLPDAYFSGTKVEWILQNVEGAKARAEAGELAFGTVDSWLIYKLTGGKTHVTDVTNASRTMLYNIRELKWDNELLKIFSIPESLLPKVVSCSESIAETAPALFGKSIPITGIAGDQQAALFGQMCVEPGMVKNTYGTGSFIVTNTGEEMVLSKNKLLTTIAWQLNGTVNYAIEGSIFIAGAVVQWLRDELNIIEQALEVNALATSVEDTGDVYFVPALSGLGAPHWDQYARGLIIGMTRGTSKAHIARAALESIAFQTADVLSAMKQDMGKEFKELRVDGGASASELLLQFQSDLTGLTVVRPEVLETTALGAAYLAGLATGYWKDVEEIKKQWLVDKSFAPKDINKEARLKRWNKAVELSKGWAEEN